MTREERFFGALVVAARKSGVANWLRVEWQAGVVIISVPLRSREIVEHAIRCYHNPEEKAREVVKELTK